MPDAYYLRLGAGEDQLMGSSFDRYHVGWIPILSFSMPDRWGPGSTSARAARPSVSEVIVSKSEDRSSTEVARAMIQNRLFTSADIELADSRTGIPKTRLSFWSVSLGDYSRGAHGGLLDATAVESFSLHFAGMRFNYNPIPEESVADMLQLAFKRLGLAAVP